MAGARLFAYDQSGRPLGVYVPDASEPTGFRVVEEYVHLDGWRPVAVVRPNATSGMVNPDIYPILTDHLGTPRKVLDSSTGQPRWEWDAKEPFGHQAPNQTPTAGLPSFALDLRFPGQRYDEATGLFQNGFRDYHAGLGRYVQSDPLGLGAGWNTYGYVGQNPKGGIDPFGLEGVGPWNNGEIIMSSPKTPCEKAALEDYMINFIPFGAYAQAFLDFAGININILGEGDLLEVGDYGMASTPLAATGYAMDEMQRYNEQKARRLQERANDKQSHYSVNNGRRNRARAASDRAIRFKGASKYFGPIGATTQVMIDLRECGCEK